jgi:hypothetical protein
MELELAFNHPVVGFDIQLLIPAIINSIISLCEDTNSMLLF